MFFFLVMVVFIMNVFVVKQFFTQFKHKYGRPTAAILRAAHIAYTRRSAHTNNRFISCDVHQLFAFKWRGRSRNGGPTLYRDAMRAAYVLGAPHARGGDLELEGVSL